MTKLVSLTELIFNGKTLIIYMLLCQNFGVLYQNVPVQSVTVWTFRCFSRKLRTCPNRYGGVHSKKTEFIS